MKCRATDSDALWLTTELRKVGYDPRAVANPPRVQETARYFQIELLTPPRPAA